jgi:hypothetical protein
MRKACFAFMEHPGLPEPGLPIWSEGSIIFACSRRSRRKPHEETAADLWRLMEQPSSNEVGIAMSLDSPEFPAAVPMTTPEQLFYSEDKRGFVLANDLRFVTGWAKGGGLRPASVFALFQYGMVPAPLSLIPQCCSCPAGARDHGPSRQSLDAYLGVPRSR